LEEQKSTVVVDPTLSTNKVAKVVKSAAAELWQDNDFSCCGLGFKDTIYSISNQDEC
jgi:hypothetical protein